MISHKFWAWAGAQTGGSQQTLAEQGPKGTRPVTCRNSCKRLPTCLTSCLARPAGPPVTSRRTPLTGSRQHGCSNALVTWTAATVCSVSEHLERRKVMSRNDLPVKSSQTLATQTRASDNARQRCHATGDVPGHKRSADRSVRTLTATLTVLRLLFVGSWTRPVPRRGFWKLLIRGCLPRCLLHHHSVQEAPNDRQSTLCKCQERKGSTESR